MQEFPLRFFLYKMLPKKAPAKPSFLLAGAGSSQAGNISSFPHQSCFRGLWRRFARTFLTCAAFSAIVSSVVFSILSQ